MPSSIDNVISAHQGPSELPAWAAKYAVLVRQLRQWELLEVTGGIQLLRKAVGYCLLDALLFFIAYFSWQGGRGGLREFCRQCRVHGWAAALAAVGDRRAWPSSAALSRLLASLRPQDVKQFREQVVGGAAVRAQVPLHPLGRFRDAHGEFWLVFDLDGVVKAFRERSLPVGEDLPEAQRRSSAMGVAGYPGRKRGETQISSHRLQQAGTELWLGQESAAGNTHMAAAVSDACAWLGRWCEQNGIDRARVVMRIDGAGGNEPCAQAVCGAGFRLLARTAQYATLDQAAVRELLQGDVYYRVPSSESGPVRHAAELAPDPSPAPGGPPMRTVVTRFPCAEPATKSGAGRVIGAAQYEMFMTDLPADGWPAEDTVALYYGRSATENCYARGNQQLSWHRLFSENRAGQDFAVQVGMLMTNLEAELGAQLLGSGTEDMPPPQARERVACHFDDLPRPEPPAGVTCTDLGVRPSDLRAASGRPPADAQPVPRPVRPNAQRRSSAAILAQLPDLRPALADRPGWRFDPSVGLLCPNRQLMRLHRQDVTARGATSLAFRARRPACATCGIRTGCTSTLSSTFAKEICLIVDGLLPPLAPSHSGGTAPCPESPATQPPGPPAATSLAEVPADVTRGPGPYLPLHAVLVPAALRRTFTQACELVVLRVHSVGGEQAKATVPAHYVPNAARRQHRRRTCAERRDWNAPPPGRHTTLEWVGGAPLLSLLTDEEAGRCAA